MTAGRTVRCSAFQDLLEVDWRQALLKAATIQSPSNKKAVTLRVGTGLHELLSPSRAKSRSV